MEFRTQVEVDKPTFSIGIKDRFITIGSCFSDSIGQRLAENKLKECINPTGTVFNPISIHKMLTMAIQEEIPRATGYCSREQVFLHHDFHSVFFDASQPMLEQKLNNRLIDFRNAIKSCRVLFITYGTAWVFEQLETRQIVANCHKMPPAQFNRFLLTQKRILESFAEMLKLLEQVNPTIQIVLTVSPVRHLKDTIPLNSVSKSILRLSCDTLTQLYPQVSYFPAYEIMLDDLRDYRFYQSDLIHPSPTAIDYIWLKFSESYFDADTRAFLEQWSKVKMALSHKAFNPSGESHIQFLRNLETELKALSNIINVEQELLSVQNQLG